MLKYCLLTCLKTLFVLFPLLLFPQSASAQILINEVFPNPSGDEKIDEWIELFNTSDQDIDINGFKLKDAAEHELIINSDHVENSTLVSANAWLVIKRNGHANFSLNNSSTEEIRLFDNQSSDPLDVFAYTDSIVEKSWGRIPDAGAILNQELDPTPGSANQPPPAPTSTPPPTPSPTKKPTSTPRPLPTPTPKITSTESITATSEAIDGSPVLGESSEEFSDNDSELNLLLDSTISGQNKDETKLEDENDDKKRNNGYLLPLLISLLGIVFLTIASAPFVKKKIVTLKKKRNNLL